ncbi:hypothetical protein P153DRAFT_365789 [Dothidotthia symphoricarpi CBS 119687]|uniref:Glycine zipper 2TM domain-containing protein n=1 Tax=Dothidotthia symphoricarpi CBS 119687 TaxID=1392245 RepID=A0A6A6AJB4_9PLEO|nr:uncharacterized protein P153DRAFT_365789 [Dothidotthia symphoricarpi CBS 119687]KAF2131195.1 hypothetical protein P153DRAFT_365789 [Dothidotthia symphoricarpi CBS 119687]
MSVLALKAIGYGAEQIPDSFFEKIPGGYFTPKEKKDRKKARKDRKEKGQRSESRRSQRDRSPSTDESDYSAYDDTDNEREQRKKKERSRRTRNAGRSSSRSLSRGRYNQRSIDSDGAFSDHTDMANVEQGQGGLPYFPPPPQSAYEAYSPQDYPQRQAQDDFYRPSSARPAYTHPSQPAAVPLHSQIHDPSSPTVAYGAEAAHRFEEIQHAKSTPGQQPRVRSTARYSPGPGYQPSPPVMPVMPVAAIPPPPIGSNSEYPPYHPAEFASGNPNLQASGKSYVAPPPFRRQRSNSQPSYASEYDAPYPSYPPPISSQQVSQYDRSPSRRDSSTKHRREHGRRARSADSHSPSRSSRQSRHQDRSRKSHHEEDSRMADFRERFDGMDLRKKSLAATVGGALAGGLAGKSMGGRSRLTAIVGAAAGALGGRTLAEKREGGRDDYRSSSRPRSRSRSRSRSRTRDRDQKQDRSLRARSKSVIDRFRGKSRDVEVRVRSRDRDDYRSSDEDRDRHRERDDRRPREDRDRHRKRDDRSSRHGRKYVEEEEYDYFTSSESEGDGSPVHVRRRTTRRER